MLHWMMDRMENSKWIVKCTVLGISDELLDTTSRECWCEPVSGMLNPTNCEDRCGIVKLHLSFATNQSLSTTSVMLTSSVQAKEWRRRGGLSTWRMEIAICTKIRVLCSRGIHFASYLNASQPVGDSRHFCEEQLIINSAAPKQETFLIRQSFVPSR